MRRLRNVIILSLAALAAGCIVEQGQTVRDQPPLETPPPPPADTAAPSYSYDSGYQAEAPPPAGSDVGSPDVFYEQLSPYGTWTYVAPYGRVWIPAVGYGWRPYYYGRWVLTDWGWTFASDDPWGWAAYHYGRWNWAVGFGWYWIPGTVWAPAWVSWRYGGGYVSWCPLGPSGVYFGYRHPAWVAVQEQHFTRPISAVAVPTQRTSGIVSQARPLTGPHATVARTGAFGPPVASVARATGQQIRPVAAANAVRPRASVQSAPRTGMQSPVQPRARGVDGAPPGSRIGAPARPGGAVVPRSPGGYAPRAAPPGGGGPR
ncbi:MAG TPA: DUF6600 domain-containing protein, partial [Myxococcales bacterium]|nr:DUF6600 domain-containing protein [Myxococcales bacterium]